MPRLTNEQAAVISAYTGVLCGPFADMHEYVERILGHPVWTHQMANAEMMQRIQAAAKDDFLALCCTDSPSSPLQEPN